MKFNWQTVADAVCFTVILRFLIAWLLANKKIQRVSFTLIAISLFFWIISYLNFPLTRILTTTLAVPLVALLLLSFLPEIRRAYEDAKLFQFLGHHRQSSSDLISHLVRSLPELCQKRMGALFVFPGRMDYKSLITSGEPYDARLSHSLLMSLLHPLAPRHDGAIIIERDRITHVGAVLPLSKSEQTPEHWGTRHLAALGLTEKCDADVLIVSEERGTLSYASEGTIEEIALTSPEALEARLTELLHQHSQHFTLPKKGKISLALWALSILIALIAIPTLKLIENSNSNLSEDKTTIMVLDVPVSLSNVPDNLYVEQVEAYLARVYVRVPQDQTNIPNSGLSIVIDLQGYPASTNTIILRKEMLKGAPSGWEVTRYEPEDLDIQLHEARMMRLKTECQTYNLAPNLKIESTKFTPEFFQVLVKDSRIEPTRLLQTAPINLASIETPGTYSFPLTIELPASIRFLNTNQNSSLSVEFVIKPIDPPKRKSTQN